MNRIASNLAAGTTIEVFKRIHEPDKNIVIFNRENPASIENGSQLAELSTPVRIHGSAEKIESELMEISTGFMELSKIILHDVVQLMKNFHQTIQANSYLVLITGVTTDMCSRFHFDVNTVRLLCTYFGPGTLWLPAEIINWEAVVHFHDNNEIVLDSTQIQQIPTGSVAIIKGAQYNTATTQPCIHRSPPVATSGERRLLLRIDTGSFDF